MAEEELGGKGVPVLLCFEGGRVEVLANDMQVHLPAEGGGGERTEVFPKQVRERDKKKARSLNTGNRVVAIPEN